MDFKIIALAHGPLVGIQYKPKEHEDDWNEFNLYMIVFCLSWRWG